MRVVTKIKTYTRITNVSTLKHHLFEVLTLLCLNYDIVNFAICNLLDYRRAIHERYDPSCSPFLLQIVHPILRDYSVNNVIH